MAAAELHGDLEKAYQVDRNAEAQLQRTSFTAAICQHRPSGTPRDVHYELAHGRAPSGWTWKGVAKSVNLP